MKRCFRSVLASVLVLIAGAAAVSAQPAGPVRRVGFLWIGAPDGGPSPSMAPFVEGMRERGYLEGRNLAIEVRDGRGDAALLGPAAASLVASAVDVIVTQGSVPTAVARQATSRISIVFGSAGDPVGRGLVASLARPGGNVTGRAIDLGFNKAYELLHEVAPTARRAGFLFHAPSTPPGYLTGFLADRKAAAAALGFEFVPLPVDSLEGVDAALTRFANAGGEALFVYGDPVLVTGRSVVTSLALRHRLATVCTDLRYAQAGCLLTYGDDVGDSFRKAAGWSTGY